MNGKDAATKACDDAESVDPPWPGGADDHWEEPTLVERAQDGDVDAFAELVDRYQIRLFRLCWRLLRDRGDAEDIVQETMIKAWRRLPLLQHPEAFGGWLYQIATRSAHDRIRSRQRHPAVPTEVEDLQTVPTTAPDPAIQVESDRAIHELTALIQQLPEDLRTCWILYAYEKLGYREISHIVAVPESTVRGRIARARSRLAEGMSAWTR